MVYSAGQGGHTIRGITDRLRNIRSGVKSVGVDRYFSGDSRGRVTKTSPSKSPHKPRHSVSVAEKKPKIKNEKPADYDGVPFHDGDETVMQEDVKPYTMPRSEQVLPTDRWLRDRAGKASFAHLLSENGDVDDEEGDASYEYKDAEDDSGSVGTHQHSEIMSPSVR